MFSYVTPDLHKFYRSLSSIFDVLVGTDFYL